MPHPFVPAEFLAKHGLDVVEMKCEQREAFVDGKPRRLFFMDGLIAGEAASAKAFADGLKAMQGACSCADMRGGCICRGQLTRSAPVRVQPSMACRCS